MTEEAPLPDPQDVNAIREELGSIQDRIGYLPAGREKALVQTKLDEAIMWLDRVPTYRW